MTVRLKELRMLPFKNYTFGNGWPVPSTQYAPSTVANILLIRSLAANSPLHSTSQLLLNEETEEEEKTVRCMRIICRQIRNSN